MKRILSLLIVLCTILPTTAWGYVYNEPHSFQTQLEDARNKTVSIVISTKYPWSDFQYERSGTGSMLGDGRILTNAHVTGEITESSYIEVTLYNKEKYFAKLLKTDKEKDLALLSIKSEAEGFTLSDTEPYNGMPIMTVGNPLGYDLWSFSEGTILNTNQWCKWVTGLSYNIMSDNETISGNSGGPLLNSDGEMMGLVRGGSPGYSFAIQMVDIKEFLKEKKEMN